VSYAASALVALWVGGCATTRLDVVSEPGRPADLAVITWNMNAGRGDLSRLATDLASGRLTGGAPVAYVLLLQEAVSGVNVDAEALAEAHHLHAFVVPVYEVQGRVRGNAIVSSRPLGERRGIPLPRERQPRMAAFGTMSVGDESLFLVSTHFENRLSWLRGGVFSDRARGRQAEALLRVLPDGPGILGGDLNTLLGPAEPAWGLFSMRFPDTPKDQVRPTFRERLTLDHLFFDLPDGWTARTRVIADRYGSDHHPVLGIVNRESCIRALHRKAKRGLHRRGASPTCTDKRSGLAPMIQCVNT
jgi:endonuclease/exonuclease/phosphatase family metal-dependent hydrolase